MQKNYVWFWWRTFKPLSVMIKNKGKATRTCGETSSSGWGEGDRRASTTCIPLWHVPQIGSAKNVNHIFHRTDNSVETWEQSCTVSSAANFCLATTDSSALFAGGAQTLFGQNSWKASWMPSEAHHRVEGLASHEENFDNLIMRGTSCFWYIFVWAFRTCTLYKLAKGNLLDPRSFAETEMVGRADD